MTEMTDATPPALPARRAGVERVTRETRIRVDVDLDGRGRGDVRTGLGFLDHMLEQLARHGLIDLTMTQTLDAGDDLSQGADDGARD